MTAGEIATLRLEAEAVLLERIKARGHDTPAGHLRDLAEAAAQIRRPPASR